MEEGELERTMPVGGFLVVPLLGAERGTNPVGHQTNGQGIKKWVLLTWDKR